MEKSTDLVKGMLQVFSTSVYALLDPGSTLSFVTPLISLIFDTLPKILYDSIVISTPLGENIRVDRVHKDSPLVVCGKTMCADLVELIMNDFDIILGMDRLHKRYTFMYYRCMVLRFCFPNEVDMV